MLKEERHALILHQVNLHNKVLSTSLSSLIAVSEDTIRRDLVELSNEGRLIKVHGGALSNSFHSVSNSTLVYARDEKIRIAYKAISLIKNGMFILTAGGTTICEMAKLLPRDLQATFITVSLPAALEYAYHPNINVIIIGEKLSKSSGITIGGETIVKLQGIQPDLCFVGVNAIDPEYGLMDNDWDVVEIKKAMIRHSPKVVALSIAEKINTHEQLKICDVEEIDMLITELDPDDEKLSPYKKKGIVVL